jgi:hypothetical protein
MLAFSRPWSRALVLLGPILSVYPAGATSLHVQYGVSLIGLPIGVANLAGTFNDTSYKIDGNAKVTGLASIITSSRGAATATGTFSGGHLLPNAYSTTAANATESRSVRMAMAGGAVRGIDISPPFEERADRIPISDTDKKDIIDPMSALVMTVPAGEPLVGAAACNRTLPIFDGGARFDVTLSYVGTRQVKTKGYAGPVTVCAARYRPIAGHRPDRKATQFMANNREIETWLAPVEGSRVVFPFRISIMTMIGMTVIEASEFTVDSRTTSAAAPN